MLETRMKRKLRRDLSALAGGTLGPRKSAFLAGKLRGNRGLRRQLANMVVPSILEELMKRGAVESGRKP